MVLQKRLNDAAIALHRILSKAGIKYPIFGGYAIAATGGERESKDIDCLTAVNKQQIIELLNGKDGFVVIPQTRFDYVAFLWSGEKIKQNAVLVEIFTEQFPGACYGMDNISTTTLNIKGLILGNGHANFLGPIYLFKGKLKATSQRAKPSDAADLQWCATRFSQILKAQKGQLNLKFVGLAIKRYADLESMFVRLGVDVEKAKDVVKDLDLDILSTPPPGHVQE